MAQNRTKHSKSKELEVVRKTNKHYMDESWVASRMEAWGQFPGNPQGCVKVYIFILEISR